VIFVPDVGSFTIEGWVDRPGTYPLTRQTTVLAAMSAGGGTLFPARLGKVEILRNRGGGGGGEGSREAEIVDIGAIRDGSARDVALRSGDIIRVPAHWVLVPPWAIYNLGRELFRIGASVPML
jgi:protein involved in polysaccharide export with SLBB domain